MMHVKQMLIFILLSFLLLVEVASASAYRRSVSFDWEAIEGAKKYEIELQRQKNDSEKKLYNFKSPKASWSGQLPPGDYFIKIRAFDERGIPGDWNEPSPFNVRLEMPQLKTPQDKLQITSKEDNEIKMNFEWSPVPGATKYKLDIKSQDGLTLISKETTDVSYSVKLPVAKEYIWQVSPFNDDNVSSASPPMASLTISGPQLKAPKIKTPDSEFVREITWTKSEFSSSYNIVVFRFSPEKKKWEKTITFENYFSEQLPFDSRWPGGKYQLHLQAKANLRPSSASVKTQFQVKAGDRSVASEYTAFIRKSIERTTDWYAVASYLLTNMNFSGSNPEKNSNVSYSALGGTGRVGLGWYGKETAWGFLSILDLSGFTVDGKTRTFACAEANAIFKQPVGNRAEIRYQFGSYYKEIPETVGNPLNGQSENLMISAIGPHLGVEYWYSMTPKIGFQFNTHFYTGALKVSTPNGKDLLPRISSQIGIMGSYKLTNRLTGLIGYAHREDKLAYNAASGDGSFAADGDINESTIVGDYLNLFAEWSF